MVADVYRDDGDCEQREPPPRSVHLPAQRAPGPQNQHEADDRDKHADGFERVSGPQAVEVDGRGQNREDAGSRQARRKRRRLWKRDTALNRGARSSGEGKMLRFSRGDAGSRGWHDDLGRQLFAAQTCPCGGEERTGGTNQRQDDGRVFGRVDATVLRINRNSSEHQNSSSKDNLFHRDPQARRYISAGKAVNAARLGDSRVARNGRERGVSPTHRLEMCCTLGLDPSFQQRKRPRG